MIMHTFADRGNTGQNKAESIENTTVSTTKAHGRIGVNANVLGEILSSKRLLRDDSAYSLQQKMLNANVTIIYNL